MLSRSVQSAKDDGKPKRKRKQLLAEIEAITGILDANSNAENQ